MPFRRVIYRKEWLSCRLCRSNRVAAFYAGIRRANGGPLCFAMLSRHRGPLRLPVYTAILRIGAKRRAPLGGRLDCLLPRVTFL